jgi:hypothetical protein
MYQILGPAGTITFTKAQILAFVALVTWSLIWKGFALWRAGRNNQLAWFVIMLLLNTAGILEIVYLLFFQPNREK